MLLIIYKINGNVIFAGPENGPRNELKDESMNVPTLVIALVIGILAAFGAYMYLRQPEPAGERLDNAVDQLKRGNLGEAGDELNNETRGDKLRDDLQDAVPNQPAN